MSKERKPRLAQRLQTDRGLYRALQRWGYYLLALMAWVTVVLAVSALGVLVCSRLTWYETDPLYHLLLWVRDYYFFFCIGPGWWPGGPRGPPGWGSSENTTWWSIWPTT